MSADVVLFDLDGTLTESAPGITRSVAFALDTVGAPAIDDATLLRFVGPPLRESFREIVALDDVVADAAVAAFVECFTERGGMFENSVYPGVCELLQVLRANGRRLGVATTKPTEAGRAVLDHFALSGFFETVCGALSDVERADKADIVRDALLALGIPAGPQAALGVVVPDVSRDHEGN
jgi:phosphoglycolate phosphatase